MSDVVLPLSSPIVVAFIAPDGQTAWALERDHKLRAWELKGPRLLRTLDIDVEGFANTVSDDGRWLMLCDRMGLLSVWDTVTGERRSQLKLDYYVGGSAFSRDGRLLALASGHTARVIDVASPRHLYDLQIPPAGPGAMWFSPNDSVLGMAAGDSVRFYDAVTGKLISQNTDFLAEPLAIDFVSDRHAVATGAEKFVLLIDVASGKAQARSKKMVETSFGLTASPNGKEIAVFLTKQDNFSARMPIVFLDAISLERKAEWMPPKAIAGATWMKDGHFLAAWQTADAWRISQVR